MARRSTPRMTASFPRTPTAEEPWIIVCWCWRRQVDGSVDRSIPGGGGWIKASIDRSLDHSTIIACVRARSHLLTRLTASMAYSTWKRWPSGEKTVMARSYLHRIDSIQFVRACERGVCAWGMVAAPVGWAGVLEFAETRWWGGGMPLSLAFSNSPRRHGCCCCGVWEVRLLG